MMGVVPAKQLQLKVAANFVFIAVQCQQYILHDNFTRVVKALP
jgi:hypothetical protein